MKFVYILVAFTFCISIKGVAQVEESPNAIYGLAWPMKDKILLRWAPDRYSTWIKANQYGYIVERFTVMRNNETLPFPEKKVLTPAPMKPLAYETWEAYAKAHQEDDYFFVAAQCLLGEDLEMEGDYRSDFYQIFQKSTEQDNRFSFFMFSAEQSLPVAEYGGLFLEDLNVSENEKYLYRIFSPITEDFPVDTALVLTSPSEYASLPVPQAPNAEWNDKMVLLTWNYNLYEDVFTSFIVERSEDGGKSFKSITENPLVNTTKELNTNIPYYFKVDSLANNTTEYQYRIRGRNAFGMVSEPSSPVSGKGKKLLKVAPVIKAHHIDGNGAAVISWEFNEAFEYEVSRFELQRSTKSAESFTRVKDEKPGGSRVFTDPKPLKFGFYRIIAHGKWGDQRISMPYMVQMLDSIPPEIPTGLTGSIDSSGYVHLKWLPNKDEDLLGYKVYQSNFTDGEFLEVTKSPVDQTLYTDTISLKTLSGKTYYKVKAIDQMYNPSEFSDVLELIKPDIIPPVSPVFTRIECKKDGILLAWTKSPSSDAKKYGLYRKSEKEQKWKLIKSFLKTDSLAYLDYDSLKYGDSYQYTVVAFDEAGLESKPAKPVSGKLFFNGIRPSVEKFSGRADREAQTINLVWKYSEADVDKFILYRALKGEKLRTYTSVNSDERKFSDQSLKINNNYLYSIKAVFNDGSESNMVQIEVKY